MIKTTIVVTGSLNVLTVTEISSERSKPLLFSSVPNINSLYKKKHM